MGAEEEKTVLDFIEVFADDWPTKEVLDQAMMLLGDNAYYQMIVPTKAPIYGREAIRAEIERQMKYDCTSQRHTIKKMASTGRFVCQERLDEAEINGKWIQAPLVAVWEVRDGKIVAWREYWDSLHIANQFGITPDEFLALGEGSPFGKEAARQ
jgi:limonene-1,2-epoxide hydrolase